MWNTGQKAAGKAPAFEKPKISQEKGGRDVVLECRSTGDPAPTYTWYQNGRELKPRANKFDMQSSKDGTVFVNTLRIMVCYFFRCSHAILYCNFQCSISHHYFVLNLLPWIQ